MKSRPNSVCYLLLYFFCCGAAAIAADTAKRQVELDRMLKLFPKSEAWEEWLKKSGELPPDFDALPSVPFLPDPLRFTDGTEVKTKEQWYKRREELLKLFQHYIIGTVPPPPGNVRTAQVKMREENAAIVQDHTLEFGPEHRAKLHMELIIPKGKGPFPVFLTQDNHRRWALVAVSRGYLGVVYAGADSRDDTGAFADIWPGYDWTKLTRRAWAASRCIDFLYTIGIVDRSKIALTGHSRNGKLSLIAAALDPRITAVISSSSGAGGACSYRYFSEAQFGEGIEFITRNFPDWLHPRLRFFAGRENKLPLDQNELIACIAPRPCLISTALNDAVESAWAIEQTCYSVARVYALLGVSQEFNLRYRPGGHETRAEDIEAYVDWLDAVFGQTPFPSSDAVIYPTYAGWQRLSGEQIELKNFPVKNLGDLLMGPDGMPVTKVPQWQSKQPEIRARIAWGLGTAPPYAESMASSYGAEAAHLATLLGRASVPNGLAKHSVNFGNYLAGDLYFPTNADKGPNKIPAVIWLHPMSNSNGYVAGYRRGEAVHLALARLGFAVFAFDEIGNGSRLLEIKNFYQRYPHWSLLGKNVEDTLAAVEAMEKVEFIDANRIFVLGYGLGGQVALHAAALSEKIAGVLSVAGFTPLRQDTADKGTGGVGRWAVAYPWQPRLGAFIGQEARIPYDYHEVLAMIAPRPVTVFAPRHDYQATLLDVRACLTEVGKVYQLFERRDKLQFYELDDYNRFTPENQKPVFERLKVMAGL